MADAILQNGGTSFPSFRPGNFLCDVVHRPFVDIESYIRRSFEDGFGALNRERHVKGRENMTPMVNFTDVQIEFGVFDQSGRAIRLSVGRKGWRADICIDVW
jgi:hypothetical protein